MDNVTTHKTKSDYCPSCKKGLNRASGIVDEEAPKPNDLSICIHCATLLTFDDDLMLDLASEELKEKIKNEDPNAWKGILDIQTTIKESYG